MQKTLQIRENLDFFYIFCIDLARLSTAVPKAEIWTDPISNPRSQNHQKQEQNDSATHQTKDQA